MGTWFQLVDSHGAPYGGTAAGEAHLVQDGNVSDLARFVKQEYADSHLVGIAATDLSAFESHTVLTQNPPPLGRSTVVGKRGRTEVEALLVRVPRKAKTNASPDHAHVLGELQPLEINATEFQLDALANLLGSDRPVIATPTMHAFWQDYGGFPAEYFVRLEECTLWQVVKEWLPSIHTRNVVLVGSPGVGKSCFLMLSLASPPIAIVFTT